MPIVMLPLISHVATQYSADEWMEGTPTTISIKMPEKFTKFLTSLAKTFDMETFELFELYFQSLVMNGLMLDRLTMDNLFESYAEIMNINVETIAGAEKDKFTTVCRKFVREQVIEANKIHRNNPF